MGAAVYSYGDHTTWSWLLLCADKQTASAAWNELPLWRAHDMQALVITCTISVPLYKSLQSYDVEF